MCATRLLRISAANIGPNRFHQNRTVSWLTSMPRSASKSSTLRSDRVSHVHHHDQTDDLRRVLSRQRSPTSLSRIRWPMEISFARHQFPPDIIRHAVWLYLRFTLSVPRLRR